MMKIPLTLKEDKKLTPANIKNWRERVSRQGWTGFHPTWPKDLWKWDYDRIISFMVKRHTETDNIHEYYDTIPYLSEDIPLRALDMPFHMRHKNPNKYNTNEYEKLKKSSKPRSIRGSKLLKKPKRISRYRPKKQNEKTLRKEEIRSKELKIIKPISNFSQGHIKKLGDK